MNKLTQAKLKKLLNYDPKTGLFVWKKPTGDRIKAGYIAGSVSKIDGYRRIKINGSAYKSSRLAWLYMEGYFPENIVDHEDRIRDNDRWNNLRHVTQVCNSRNCKLSKVNKSGITGVYWHARNQKWRAQIKIFYKYIHLGYFNSKLNAAKARWKAEVKHEFPNCNTTSTAYLYIQANH